MWFHPILWPKKKMYKQLQANHPGHNYPFYHSPMRPQPMTLHQHIYCYWKIKTNNRNDDQQLEDIHGSILWRRQHIAFIKCNLE